MSTAPSTATSLTPPESAVRGQFSNPPSLESVTRSMLAAAIEHEYPTLTLDLERTQLAVPQLSGGWILQPFMPRVLAYLGSSTELDLSPIEGQAYYLSDTPPTLLRPTQGELDMKVIERLVKELSWRLPIGLQGALTDFWGEESGAGVNRWQWFSDVIKDTLSISALTQADLTDAARDSLYQVIRTPVREDRIRLYGERAVAAYWLKASLLNANVGRSILSSRIALETSGQVLVHNPGGVTRTFNTMDSLGRAWNRRISQHYTIDEIRLKRFELDGNVFDACAAAVLSMQLEHIGLIKLPATMGWDRLQAVYLDITNTAKLFVDAPQANIDPLTALERQLPDWLKNASASDHALYRQYSLALSTAKKINHGKTYLHGILDIHAFAANALHQQLQRDQQHFENRAPVQALENRLHPDNIELTFHVATGLPGTIGIIELVTMSLTDLALKNLVGRPKGTLTLRSHLGIDLPAWLTADYITQSGGLIEQVNIGKVYPERLEQLLLSGTPEANAREKLFAEQVSAQLPLEALELSLKKQNGVTPLGARYVAALMQASTAGRVVDGKHVVIRHLALVRRVEAIPDIVSNMFIIEPSNIEDGPHLLYRPLYAQSLLEFPTRAALLDAIAEPGELQNSVLTWLSDIARPIYAHGGIKEPHYVRFGLGSEFGPLEVPEPAFIATNGTNNELLQYLNNGQLMLFIYGSNARALVEQANTDSVSNSESRWAVLLEGGNLLFNNLLFVPGLPPPLMLTGGLLSLTAAVSSDIPALASNDPATRELAAADVLLNVAMLLFHQAAARLPRPAALPPGLRAQALRTFAPLRLPELWPEPPAPKMTSGAVALPGEYPNTESTVLDFSFASAQNRLTPRQRERLAGFEVPLPESLPPAQPTSLRTGLYRIADRWHALIEQTLYPVDVDMEGAAVIISASDPHLRGPNLKSDKKGHWSFDLRLRLRGGMPPKRIAALQQQKIERTKQLDEELEAFFKQEEPLHKAVDITQSALERAETDERFTPEQLDTFRDRFEMALKKQRDAYQQLLESNKERTELKVPFHDRIVISLLQKLFDNSVKSLVRSGAEQRALLKKWAPFARPGPQLEQAATADPEAFLRFVREEVALNERTLQRLELRNSYVDQLYNHSEAGTEAANRLVADLSPDEHTPLSIKSFHLGCLKLASSKVAASTLTETGLDEAVDHLKEHIQTHDALNTLEFSPEKRLEVLDSLEEHYGQALDAMRGLAIVNADDLEFDYFNKLRHMLEGLYQDATTQLAAEIKPALKPRKKPRRRPLSVMGRPSKKIINVRGKGQLIGELKPASNEWPIETVEIRSGYDRKLLSTYSQHGDEWLEIETAQPHTPAATRALNIVKGEARKLFSKFENVLKSLRESRKRYRYPQAAQEAYDNEAKKLDTLATEMDAALQNQPPTSRLPDDQALVEMLRKAAQSLFSEGHATRVQLSLELPPTNSNLQFLLDQRVVQLASLGKRIPLRGERQDFMQEYAINNREGFPIWYAHFHYPLADTPNLDYSAAHLKTKAQRKLNYFSQVNDAQGEHATVNVHRGEIGKDLARHWFVPLVEDAK